MKTSRFETLGLNLKTAKSNDFETIISNRLHRNEGNSNAILQHQRIS